MTLLNEGVEIDHLCMCVQCFEHSRAGYPFGERRYSGVDGSFRHDESCND